MQASDLPTTGKIDHRRTGEQRNGVKREGTLIPWLQRRRCCGSGGRPLLGLVVRGRAGLARSVSTRDRRQQTELVCRQTGRGAVSYPDRGWMAGE